MRRMLPSRPIAFNLLGDFGALHGHDLPAILGIRVAFD